MDIASISFHVKQTKFKLIEDVYVESLSFIINLNQFINQR